MSLSSQFVVELNKRKKLKNCKSPALRVQVGPKLLSSVSLTGAGRFCRHDATDAAASSAAAARPGAPPFASGTPSPGGTRAASAPSDAETTSLTLVARLDAAGPIDSREEMENNKFVCVTKRFGRVTLCGVCAC